MRSVNKALAHGEHLSLLTRLSNSFSKITSEQFLFKLFTLISHSCAVNMALNLISRSVVPRARMCQISVWFPQPDVQVSRADCPRLALSALPRWIIHSCSLSMQIIRSSTSHGSLRFMSIYTLSVCVILKFIDSYR